MAKRFERHAKTAWEWGAEPSRSAERTAAAAENVAGPAKRAPGRKDRWARCKANNGGPHEPAIVLAAVAFPGHGGLKRAAECYWTPAWSRRRRCYEGVGWICRHEEHCRHCGKVFRASVRPGECPAYPGDPAQRAAAEADVGRYNERQAAWRSRKPPITGPQGYRRQRADA
jgi:hypothetical protein